LKIAKELDLNVVGVSFHVGSGCRDASAYIDALNDTLKVFEAAKSLSMNDMTVVDIGGGFPGDKGGYGGPDMPSFQELAATIRHGIAAFKTKLGKTPYEVRFIAEPGRYFASAATSVATKIYSRKGGNSNSQALYVDDGVYGSFNSVLYDHATPIPSKVPSKTPDNQDEEKIPTAVFGPTCDGLDQMCDLRSTKLCRCKVGDWLLWDNMGAYTHTASFVFNGYTHIPNKIHCVL
jgi:diaminopimelate decarboxylase